MAGNQKSPLTDVRQSTIEKPTVDFARLFAAFAILVNFCRSAAKYTRRRNAKRTPRKPLCTTAKRNILRRFSNSDTLFGPKSVPDGEMGPNRNTNTTNRTAEADCKIKEMVEPKLEVVL